MGKSRIWYLLSITIIVLLTFSMILINIQDCNFNSDSTHPDQNPFYTPTTRSRTDTDGDGLSDSDEVAFNTEMTDPDTDDDGVLDGQEGLDITKNELHEVNDPDGDGWNNARDADSDNDGIYDGTECGLTYEDVYGDINYTDLDQGNFVPDADPTTTTDPTNRDTDGDTLADGDEDRNGNGKYEKSKGETDPNFKDYDDDGLQDDLEDGDDDNDGMPDKFEKLFWLNPWDASDRDEDLDNDSFSNYREYLGNDNATGNEDWSDPTDPTKKPNVAPIVSFLNEEIYIEAKQEIIFDGSLLKVIDDNEDKGLTFVWDWDDGSEIFTKLNVRPKRDPPQTHIYEAPGEYTIKLEVIDDIGNTGEATLKVDVTHSIGGSEIVLDIPFDKTEFKDKKTIRRSGWMAYKITDLKYGEEITIDFEVIQRSDQPLELGIRVFIIPEENFEVYKNNNPTSKGISRKYEEYWSGLVSEVKSSKQITFKSEDDENIYVILDNRFYEEGRNYINIDEPMEYEVSIRRKEAFKPTFDRWVLPIIALGISIILASIIVSYTKINRDKVLEHKTREDIYSHIKKHPGIHYRGVMNDLNLNMGVLSHHLNMLEQQKYIKSYQDGMYRRFYPVNVKQKHGVNLNDAQEQILRTVRSFPGISQSNIARFLNQNRKSVHYNIKRLSDEGLILVETAGRETRCYYLNGLQFSKSYDAKNI